MTLTLSAGIARAIVVYVKPFSWSSSLDKEEFELMTFVATKKLLWVRAF